MIMKTLIRTFILFFCITGLASCYAGIPLKSGKSENNQTYEMKDRKAFTIFSKKCTHAQEHVFKRVILGNDFRRGSDIRIYRLLLFKHLIYR